MPLYRYRAISADGQVVTGEYSGDTPSAVRDYLLSRQLFPDRISRVFRPASRGREKVRFLVFVQSFELLLKSGLDAIESLRIATDKVASPSLRQSLESVGQQVVNGQSLATAFANDTSRFDSQWVAALRAGEASGDLAKSVALYRKLKERLQEVSQKVQAAVTYPLILVGMIVVVLAVLLTVVVPRLTEGYGALGSDLPLLTQLVVSGSELFPYIAIALPAFWILATVIARSRFMPERRAFIRRRLLDGIPMLGVIRIEYRIVNISATLSMLLSAGNSPQRALRLLAEGEPDADIRARFVSAAQSVELGRGLVTAFRALELFPDTAIQLFEAGEKSGDLGATLHRVSRFYLGHLDLSVQRFVSVIEPLLMIIIGLVIGLVVVAVYLPIFSMTQVIG